MLPVGRMVHQEVKSGSAIYFCEKYHFVSEIMFLLQEQSVGGVLMSKVNFLPVWCDIVMALILYV